MITYSKLYKLDSKGKLRVYFIEWEGDQYRMVTGLADGKQTRSKWTVAEPKNVGRSNETTGTEQAAVEAMARYTKKKAQGYFNSEEEARDNPDGNFFQPMLAEPEEKVIVKYKVYPLIADPKLDGMRMTVLEKDCISRKGKPIFTADHILDELEQFFIDNPKVRLDGELYNHEYKEDFNTLMSIARQMKPTEEDLKIAHEKLEFHVYDCYHYDVPEMTAMSRKLWLDENLPLLHTVKLINWVVVNNVAELDAVKEQNLIDGYEGTITRGPNSVYENKRSRWLLKHKDFITEEFKVNDILVGKGNRSGIAGTVEVIYKGNIVGCGVRGSHEYAKKLLENRDDCIGKLATIRHFGETPDVSLRFPVCIDIDRPDL